MSLIDIINRTSQIRPENTVVILESGRVYRENLNIEMSAPVTSNILCVLRNVTVTGEVNIDIKTHPNSPGSFTGSFNNPNTTIFTGSPSITGSSSVQRNASTTFRNTNTTNTSVNTTSTGSSPATTSSSRSFASSSNVTNRVTDADIANAIRLMRSIDPNRSLIIAYPFSDVSGSGSTLDSVDMRDPNTVYDQDLQVTETAAGVTIRNRVLSVGNLLTENGRDVVVFILGRQAALPVNIELFRASISGSGSSTTTTTLIASPTSRSSLSQTGVVRNSSGTTTTTDIVTGNTGGSGSGSTQITSQVTNTGYSSEIFWTIVALFLVLVVIMCASIVFLLVERKEQENE